LFEENIIDYIDCLSFVLVIRPLSVFVFVQRELSRRNRCFA